MDDLQNAGPWVDGREFRNMIILPKFEFLVFVFYIVPDIRFGSFATVISLSCGGHKHYKDYLGQIRERKPRPVTAR